MASKRRHGLRELGKLGSRKGIFTAALMIGTIASLVLTTQSVATYIAWSDAVYHSTMDVADVDLQHDLANNTVWIIVTFLARNPSESKLDLSQVNFELYVGGTLITGSGYALVNPSKEVFRGHDALVNSSTIVLNRSIPAHGPIIDYLLNQAVILWHVSSLSARFYTTYGTRAISFLDAFFMGT